MPAPSEPAGMVAIAAPAPGAVTPPAALTLSPIPIASAIVGLLSSGVVLADCTSVGGRSQRRREVSELEPVEARLQAERPRHDEQRDGDRDPDRRPRQAARRVRLHER